MDSQKLQDWLQIVGLAAVVASLVFVGLQLKQSDEIALAEVFESAAARGVEQRALIAEHAETWRKACLGEPLADSEKLIAGSIYFNYIQNSFNSWSRFDETELGFGAAGNQFYVDSLCCKLPPISPVSDKWLCRGTSGTSSVRALKVTLIDEFGELLRQRIVELQQLEPDPAADVMWCGIR